MINIEEVKKRIKLLGLRKDHVAKNIDKSPAQLSQYLSGKRQMPDDTQLKLKQYLGL